MARTLWSRSAQDAAAFDYTAASDHEWDARLLRWDVLGSLGHVEGLRASGILSAGEHRRLQAGLRRALREVNSGRLRLGRSDEDVHTAVENWLTRRLREVGEMVHTGRSRNDQVACDIRLFLKDRLLAVHQGGLALVEELLRFARRESRSLWPGYTHTRRAMPSSAALWAGGLAEGLLDTLTTLPAVWAQVDRSPLGSAAGYGVPLPLKREATARALGFGGMDQLVTTPQNARGKLEAAVLFWCCQLGHDLGRLAGDVILWSSDEFGWLELPAGLVTGSSIMPHKKNPDLFELTRGRAALLEGDLGAVLALRGGLTSGYHRDYQLLKEPLMRGLDRAESMLAMMTRAVPGLRVDRARARAAIEGGTLATDEVMRRVEQGEPFRRAYRAVARELGQGARFEAPTTSQLFARRKSTGGLGNPGLGQLAARNRALLRWGKRERARFDRAMAGLAGRAGV